MAEENHQKESENQSQEEPADKMNFELKEGELQELTKLLNETDDPQKKTFN